MTTTTNLFESVADEIINKSINSIIFVDDQLAEPFSKSTEAEIKLSEEMYKGFRKESCSVDFFKFKSLDDLKSKEAFVLQARDLLVLDWQLANEVPEYLPCLELINQAVTRPNLHFICIYTATEPSKFTDVIYKINSYFAPYKSDVLREDLEAIKNIVEQEGFSFEDVFDEEVKTLLREIVIYRDKSKELFVTLKTKIQEKSKKEVYDLIQKYLIEKSKEDRYRSLPHAFCGIGMFINEERTGSDSSVDVDEIKNYVNDNILIVNHTIILITNKEEVSSQNLYTKFKEAIINNSGNFLTLMGLEMRSLFKESSGFIGKDIDSIDEVAFFHHKNVSFPLDAFYDFLRELWKNQASAFLYDKLKQPKIFDALDAYKEKRKIEDKLTEFLASPKSYEQDLGKLNFYYNVVTASKDDNNPVGFGDIFAIQSSDSKPTDHYLLCITAHCDCLYSNEKIQNMFYFVKGSKCSLEKALKDGDTQFYSYVKNKGKVEAIKWKDKPFTVYIKPELNVISKDIGVNIGEDNRMLKYVCTLKENYAQRIANGAFSYPFHVGIFFANTKNVNGEKKSD